MKNEIEKTKEKANELIEEYVEKHRKTLTDKWGNVVSTYVDVNPIIISNKFFGRLVPIDSNPTYNANDLAVLYQYYEFILTKVNEEIGDFPSSLTLFCKMIGLTLKQFQDLKVSSNENMRNIVEKIYNDIEEYNLAMSQMGKLKERTTLFKLKSQNEMVEKVQPRVNITYKQEINSDKIKGNIDAYAKFIKKYGGSE